MVASNPTLDDALMEAALQSHATFRERLQMRVCLIRPLKRRQLELAVTELAADCGVIPLTASEGGIYTGPWMDLLQWIVDNWPRIMEIVVSIIALF